MRITKLKLTNYKNLQNFEWELNPDYPVAVIVGKNGSGKTNLLEAIITIFQDLQLYSEERKRNTLPKFEFEIEYLHQDDIINIKNNGKLEITRTYEIKEKDENGKDIEITKAEIVPLSQLETLRQDASQGKDILPKSIFVYYAGNSTRLKKLVHKSIDEYESLSRQPSFQYALSQPLFYYEPLHYRCVFLALFVSSLERIKDDFLENDLGIEGLESVEFVITRPEWNRSTNEETFWDAPAYLQNFLGFLKENFKSREILEKYRFKFNIPAKTLIDAYPGNEMFLFRQLSNLTLSGFLSELDLNFKKQNVKDSLRFDDLSEGEWQRIAIRGIMEIFSSEDTLFLFDEPDTFAHPRWQWEFVPDLEKAIGDDELKNTQTIFITHSPLVLSSVKKNVFMMQKGGISALKEIYGEKPEIVLSKMHGDSDKVEDDFALYFELIEQGKGETEEALAMRKDLVAKYGVNHSEIARADMWIAFYK